MQKVQKVILIISLVTNVFFGFLIFNSAKENTNSREYIEKIDSLELEISNLIIKKDSIRKQIDTVYVSLNKIDKDYEEIRSIIINNSTSEDYLFFTKYLERNRARLDSINNSGTAQGN